MKKLLILLAWASPWLSTAQMIIGKVVNENQEALSMANVYWSGTTLGVSTETDGTFSISTDGIIDHHLVASYVGYRNDTVFVKDRSIITFALTSNETLDEVMIKARRNGIIISDISAIKTESITTTELKKAACCDLAGCFETQTTIQPQTTNVITNSKELRILGLPGVYNQVLIDGFPLIQGLSYTYGLSSVPGTMVQNIHVSKGANSVLQGFESISGQIYVETVEPASSDKLLLNVYANNFGERHINANYAFKIAKWSNITSIHHVQPARRVDRDKDDFLDVPLLNRSMIASKWTYGRELDWGWSSRINLRYLNEQRIGGQMLFDPRIHSGSTTIYGQNVAISQPELSIKTNYRLNDEHNFAIYAAAFHQQQSSFFGSTLYDALQTNAFFNAQYEFNYGSHDLKTGLSYRYLTINEDITFTDDFLNRSYDGNHRRLEHIPGVFAENTLHFLDDKLIWLFGVRADRHHQFGTTFTPRTTLKYDIAPRTIARANIGSGWRTVNLFSENIGLLSSSRDILVTEELLPERALNYGINLIHKFETKNQNISGHISADYYRTHFSNQIFPDFDSDPTKAIIQNFTGRSTSNGFQTELLISLFQEYQWKAGYRYLDVYQIKSDTKYDLPFNPRHKLMSSFSYAPVHNKFHVDITAHWTGAQRLPDTRLNPAAHRRPDFSESFTVLNAQFTYNFSKIELYIGCENIFDFRQLRPIISWENPFSPYFDTSSVWGPTRGREAYVGLRYRIERKEG